MTASNLDSPSCYWLEDGLDDDASSSPSSSNTSVCSSHKHRLGRLAQNNVLDPKHLPIDIDTLVEKMVCVREDRDKAETKLLCSKLFEIIQDMQRDEEVVSRNVGKNKVGLVTPLR